MAEAQIYHNNQGTNLKDCPFCGHNETDTMEYRDHDDDENERWWKVRCSECWCGTDGWTEERQAVIRWEQRVTPRAKPYKTKCLENEKEEGWST